MKGLRFAQAKLDLARLRIGDAVRLRKRCGMGDQSVIVDVTNPRELSRLRAYATKEPQTLRWIAEYIKAGDVFYDIGANIGLYSIFAAKRQKGQLKVYSFEPESQNYASLNRNVHVNGLSDAITTLCLAVSDTDRIDNFFVRGNLRAGEAIHQFSSPTDDLGIPFNPVHQQGMLGITLDSLCFTYKLSFPTHIKIDVDGHEAAVISGAGRVLADGRLKTVLLEVTESPSRRDEVQQIYAKFQEAGFSVLTEAPTSASKPESHNVIFLRADQITGLDD